MLHAFGTETYGVLSVTWMVLANFSWLDFGFSRASARYVSQELAQGRHSEAALWTFTALVSQVSLGLVGALCIWASAPFIVSHIHVQPEHRGLVVLTLRLFALCIPIDFASRSILGVLQAAQRFDWVNGLGIVGSLSTFGVYGLGILRGANFAVVIYGLFILRIVNLLMCYWGATFVLPSLKQLSCLARLSGNYQSRVIVLARYGLWVTLASIVVPLLLFFDQWMITLIVGVSVLPYYTVPSNLLWRLGVLPNSLTSTLFPAFSAMEARTDWARIENFFIRAHRYLLSAIVPILFVLFCWGGEILRLWIGANFAAQSTVALRILVFGFLIGLLAPLSGALLEAVGRPDLLVKLYCIELPLNIIAVWSLTKSFGVAGAALSYTVRTALETILLFVILYRVVPLSFLTLLKNGVLRPILPIIPLSLAAYWLQGANVTNYPAIGATLAILVAYSLYAYGVVFDRQDISFGLNLYRTKRDKLREKILGRRLALSRAENS